MRLFIGLALNTDLKQKLYTLSQNLVKDTMGRATSVDNYHITLAFLGEVDEAQCELIKTSLQTLDYQRFELYTDQTSYFQKGERYIYFTSLKPSAALHELYQKVIEHIKPLSLTVSGAFHPHITLIRQGRALPFFKLTSLDESLIEVSSITLFESHSIDGVLTYTPILHHNLI